MSERVGDKIGDETSLSSCSKGAPCQRPQPELGRSSLKTMEAEHA
jgi:hypothetical protein